MTITIAGIFAHPDDEAFLAAGILYEAALRGHRTAGWFATPGDAGKTGFFGSMPPEELASLRRKELAAATQEIRLSELRLLDYRDGEVNRVDPDELLGEIAHFLNELHADVVLTFSEDGGSGHPDHIAVHHATWKAVTEGSCPSVQKLYVSASRPMREKGHSPSYSLDIAAHWTVKKRALLLHESQILAVERVFGSLLRPDTVSPMMRREAFILAWERGKLYPAGEESFLTDGLDERGD
jgi:LmbE family N-acetylglucosaminyl deacetylase